MSNQQIYNFLLGLAILIAAVFIVLILVTSKGDAMSGGGAVRTTFKGRATVDDQIAKLNMYLAGGFLVAMIALDYFANRVG
ncbi:MAG: preprotein translocase subunit SecG [Chthonomonas sp.]|nr:preprotein translocase subunit SecG [Chthonomonas sp.]